MERCWGDHYGTVCVAINWDLFSSLEDAKVLIAHSRGGLPDLTLWSPAELSYKVSQAFLSTLSSVCAI